MRRVVPFIAGLYPRAWRERYGEEFEALLGEVNPSFATVVNVLGGAISMRIRAFSYGWMVALAAACSCAVFAAELYFVPEQYASEALLRIDSSDPPEVKAADVRGLAERVESRKNLTGIIISEKLYERERTRMVMMDVLERMRGHLSISPIGLEGQFSAFKIEFEYPERHVAQRVTTLLIHNFIEESAQAEKNGSATTLQILDYPSLSLKSPFSAPSAAAVLAGLLSLGGLGILRWRSLKKASAA